MSSRANPPAEELYARKWPIFAVAMTGLFMALIDVTIVNIALPTLQDELDAGVDDVSWVLNAYNLVFAVVGPHTIAFPAAAAGPRHRPARCVRERRRHDRPAARRRPARVRELAVDLPGERADRRR